MATLTYVAASCNRYSNVSDCRADGIVAFGSGHFIGIWDSNSKNSVGVSVTLSGHLGDISVLEFISYRNGSSFFVSGDTVGVTRVWRESDSKWSCYAVLTGHVHSVSALSTLELPSSDDNIPEFLIVTGSSDGTIRSWKVSTDSSVEPELLQTISLGGKLALEIALSYLPASKSIALAVGSTENRVQIYTASTQNKVQFTKALSLEGHSDWIRSLTFITPRPIDLPHSTVDYHISPGELLLASGSQDNYIRLWKFSRLSFAGDMKALTGFEGMDELERKLSEAEAGEDGELRVKAHDFRIEEDGEFSCSAEAVLLGHDAWVTGLHWAPLNHSTSPISDSEALPQELQLLSSSADRSMILWTPSAGDNANSIWTSSRRFGEFSSATNLGFFGALWGVNSKTVLAHGWGGSWHVWREEEGDWNPVIATGGHFSSVKSIAWEPKGEYLLSAGSDMTTRLHAPWRRTAADGSELETWHELGRPQIHGYPIASVTFTDRLQFISGADEKIVRVFDAPKVFLTSLNKLSLISGLGDEESRPMAANVPPLGLSNRAIATPAEADAIGPESNDPFAAVLLPINFNVASHPPFEEQLLGSTLWPETDKIYGHGYEIIAVASSHSSSLIATACKATLAEHAVIRLYDTKTWKPVGNVLEGHSLTITSISFSPDDKWILSVSRDRTWRLYERIGESYVPSASSKLHARIIWDCCWSTDSTFFATASRDKTVKVWYQSNKEWDPTTIKFDEAATAVATCLISNPPRHLLAVGLENGHIHLYTALVSDPNIWSPHLILDSTIAHVLSVTALSFCPKVLENGKIRLGSGSDDKSTRIIDLTF